MRLLSSPATNGWVEEVPLSWNQKRLNTHSLPSFPPQQQRWDKAAASHCSLAVWRREAPPLGCGDGSGGGCGRPTTNFASIINIIVIISGWLCCYTRAFTCATAAVKCFACLGAPNLLFGEPPNNRCCPIASTNRSSSNSSSNCGPLIGGSEEIAATQHSSSNNYCILLPPATLN